MCRTKAVKRPWRMPVVETQSATDAAISYSPVPPVSVSIDQISCWRPSMLAKGLTQRFGDVSPTNHDFRRRFPENLVGRALQQALDQHHVDRFIRIDLVGGVSTQSLKIGILQFGAVRITSAFKLRSPVFRSSAT